MLFDPRRNLLTVILAGGLGVLVLAAGVQALFLGRPDPDAIRPAGDAGAPAAMVSAPETGLSDLRDYGVITDRPLFWADRTLPEITDDAEVEDEAALAEEQVEEPIEELKASIAGIIITPELRMALVNDNAAGKTLVLQEGMSLEGEQADWQLESIAPRRARFVASDGKQAELELAVNTDAIKPGRRPAPPVDDENRRANTPNAAQSDAEARARAEEVRRRVAERRAQLRAEAERRAREARENNGGN